MSQRRLTSRDYKNVRQRGFDWRNWREFGVGLAAGLAVALMVLISERRARTAPVAEAAAADALPRPSASSSGVASDGAELPGETSSGEDYAFYDMLPKFEVVVPEQEREVRRVNSAAKIERPGTYYLQAGSFRELPDAERVATQLSRMGISAKVQRVAVDADVWHRVRIGPITDLAQLNGLRQQLHAADVDTLVSRVEE